MTCPLCSGNHNLSQCKRWRDNHTMEYAMHQCSAGQKLQAISTLPVGRGGIASYDARDVELWCALAGPAFDTSALSDLTLERIATIYYAHFE